MWFSMPEGCGGITVELQAFNVEIKDDEGKGYFRAPDHFAPRILQIPGFALAQPPEGAPDDLPKSDPLRDGAISELTRRVAAQDMEIQGLREDLGAAHAQLTALMNENATLKKVATENAEVIADLQEKLEDAPAAPITGAKAKA